MTEHQQQSLLFEWAEYISHRNPSLKLMFAIPNGGKRHVSVGAKMKREGAKAGVPDICLPVPSGEYHGMFIEMKNGKKGRLSEQQSWWLKNLSEKGYYCVVCYSSEEAIEEIESYLRF